LTYQGVRKAAWNGFRMLNHLGSKRLAVTGGSGNADGVDAIATLSASGDEVAIIVYNYHATIDTTGSDAVTLNVNNLPFAGKQIFVTKVAVDEEHSNPYGVWVEQGRPRSPTEEQWQAMRKAQHLALLEPVTSVAGAATFSASLTLPRQGAAMILLGPNRPVIGRDARVEIEGEDYDGQSGATKGDSKDESMGQAVAGKSGSYVYFEQVDFGDAGVDSVQLRVDAPSATTLELRADTQDGPMLGSCAVSATAGSWATQKCMLAKSTAVHTVYAVFGGEMRLNWMKFEAIGGSSGGGGSGGMPSGTSGAGGGPMPAGGGAGLASGGSAGVPPSGSGGAMTQAGGSGPMSAGAPAGGRGGASQVGGAAPTGNAATAGTAPAAGGGPASDGGDSGGCGCRLASNRNSTVHAGLIGLGLGLLLYRRRRR
jgi:MYXO-CTERM domain-containing protein